MYTALLPAPATATSRPAAAIFLSGSGSNAERILERYTAEISAGQEPPFLIAALVTDNPEKSRANELGEKFHLPVIAEDIRKFYHDNGEKRVSIATARGQELRQQWTNRLRARLAEFKLSFGIFAGFVPLTNLTQDFPCLNVHPGDLTYLKNGRRYLVGLHEIPIERAILEGLDAIRSSVIIAGAYTGTGDDMDNGAILGISPEVPVEYTPEQLSAFQAIAAARPPRPAGGYHDALEEFASAAQDALKKGGDWVVFPPVLWDFADNRFFISDDHPGQLFFRCSDSRYLPIQTVEYHADGSRELRLGR